MSRNPQLDSGSVQRSCWKLQRNKPKTQQRVLKCGKRTNRLKGVARNCSEELKSNPKKTGLDYQNLQATDDKYVERVFTNLRRKSNRSENDERIDLKTNVLIWGQYSCRQR